MSMKSLQGRHTPGSRDECRTAPDSCRPLDQSDRLEPLGSYETTSTIAIYYYSARKLILILPSHRG